MARYQAFDPANEVIGATAMALINNIQSDEIVPLLEKNGLADMEPDQWYPLQDVLNVMSDISENPNATTNFVSVGMAAATIGIQSRPPEAQQAPLRQILEQYGEYFPTRFRNGDLGFVRTQVVNDDHFIVEVKTAFPDDIFYGIMYAYARHYKPEGKHFTVKYDENASRRDFGAEVTLIHIVLS